MFALSLAPLSLSVCLFCLSLLTVCSTLLLFFAPLALSLSLSTAVHLSDLFYYTSFITCAFFFMNLCDSFKLDATRRNLSSCRCLLSSSSFSHFSFSCCYCCLGCANRRVNSLSFVFASSGCCRCYYCLFFCSVLLFFATLSFFIV